jgi:P27 family predicted phage terminase small subunit
VGKRGPPPKPTALKLLQGTHRPDRAPKNEPKPKIEKPTCPAWLSKVAKAEWRRVSGDLVKLGLLSKLDRSALAAYCEAYAEWRAMEELLREVGRTQESESGYVLVRPEVATRNQAAARMKAFLAEFGMSPAARTRVEAEAHAEPTGSAFDRFRKNG